MREYQYRNPLLQGDGETLQAQVLRPDGSAPASIALSLPGMTREERDIILAGCLINYYAS